MQREPESAAIEIRDLTVVRGGDEVLHGLTLQIAPGRITGLLGPSGCGKTTLMRAIVGVQVVAAGEVRVLGAEAGSAPLRRRVGYVTQAPSVYGDLTVRENLEYFSKVLAVPERRIDEVLEAVSLEARAGQIVESLSGGQRARVSLATALLNSPDLLILDEPTVGLDPVLREELWARFHELTERGTTLLVSSHVMDEASRCDALLLMREGEILRQGTPAELRRDTGEEDIGGAFLALVAAAESGEAPTGRGDDR
ncbi:MAG TPA: ABC transporter ATP-binding protein [Solirubrobacterales bacterium]